MNCKKMWQMSTEEGTEYIVFKKIFITAVVFIYIVILVKINEFSVCTIINNIYLNLNVYESFN